MTEQQALQLIDERDAAQDAIAKAYKLVTGQDAEWSNNFGYSDALAEIEEWCAPLPVRSEPLTPRENEMIFQAWQRHVAASPNIAKEVLAELNLRVHSGYDFNADPDSVTLAVGCVLRGEPLPVGWAAGAGVWRCAPPAEKETTDPRSETAECGASHARAKAVWGKEAEHGS